MRRGSLLVHDVAVRAVAEGRVVGLLAVAEVDGLRAGRLEVQRPQLDVEDAYTARLVAQGLRPGLAARTPRVQFALLYLHLEGHLSVHHASLVLELALVGGAGLVERVGGVLEALVEVQLPCAFGELRRVGVDGALLVGGELNGLGGGEVLGGVLALQAAGGGGESSIAAVGLDRTVLK